MFQQFFNYLLPILRLQFFLTIISMPILVWWGLPVSALSVIGNLIFAPFLTIFLFLSSLIFFSELACVPNSWLIFMLEAITNVWLKIVPSNYKFYWLLFPKKTCLIFMISILLSLYMFIYLRVSKHTQTIILGTLLISSCAVAKLPIWVTESTTTIDYRNKSMEIKYHNGALTINDTGILNYYAGIENWINYTLSPLLIKKFGSIKIRELYLAKNNKNTRRNLELIKTNLLLEHVYFKN